MSFNYEIRLKVIITVFDKEIGQTCLKFGWCIRWEFLWLSGSRTKLWHHSKQVRTPVMLLRSLSDKYPGEKYESSYPPAMG